MIENENKKINFFERVKIAVTKLENYNIFLEERISVVVKYFFILVLILSAILGVVQTYSFMKAIHRGYQYIKNELPDFSYTSDGTLIFSEKVNSYDKQLDFNMIADTSEGIDDEKIQQYKESINSLGAILLKDKFIYIDGNNEISYKYQDIIAEYQIDSLDKSKLIEKIDSIGMVGIASTIFLALTITVYIINSISIFMDWLIITLFAYCVSRICRINMTLKQVFNISIYALTLSIILSLIYNIAYHLVGFYTDYFRIVYLLIAYVYVTAAILMIKSDYIKQQVEVEKIVKDEKKIHTAENLPEEKDTKTEENKDNQNEDEDDKNIDEEPDGSEI